MSAAEIGAALGELGHDAALNLAKAAGAFFDRGSFFYWPYAVSTVLVAAAAWRWLGAAGGAPRTWGEFARRFLGAGLWWHRSARADYALYFANALVLPALGAFLLVESGHLACVVGGALGVPEPGPGTTGGALARALYTVAFFIAYDFGRFAAHCLLHDVPWLWEFHKIHHSAQVLTPVTSYRAHPVELLLMAWGPLAATAAVTVAFNAAGAGGAGYYSFLGLHVFLFGLNLVDNLRHSPLWLSYGPAVGRWLVSPAHHQLHHSCEPRHFGRNRGFALALWDRLYGTLYVPGREPEAFRLGLGDGSEERYHSLGRMYLLPFAALARRWFSPSAR